MADLSTVFTSLSLLAFLGFILNIVSARLFVGTGRISRLKVVAILKGVINISFIFSWAAFLFGYPVLSIPLFFITGSLLILLIYLLFNIVHDQIYVKRGAEFASIAAPIIAVLQTTEELVAQYKDIIANAYAIGLGFMLGISFLTVIYAYQLYQEMRGGASIWLLIAVYVGTIFLVSLMGVLATFYNIYGVLTDIDSFVVNMAPMIIPDIVMIATAVYYKRVVYPIIRGLVEEAKA